MASDLPGDEQTVLDVHGALKVLEKADPGALETTERTVQRDWEKARLILAAALR